MSLGKVAYEAYRTASEGKSLVSGERIPAWPDLPEKIGFAWEAAANAVANVVEDEFYGDDEDWDEDEEDYEEEEDWDDEEY